MNHNTLTKDIKSYILKLTSIMFIFFGAFSFQSCSDDESDPVIGPSNGQYDQTIIMYLPWALKGDGTPFYNSFFQNNINELERGIVENQGTNNKAIYVFVCQSETRSALVKFNYHKSGRVARDTVEIYNTPATHFISSEGIKSIINTVKSKDKSRAYGMIFGCHGQGWMPAGKEPSHTPTGTGWGVMKKKGPIVETRWIGSGQKEYQISISDLANAIKSANSTMDFILFDACYMANIETAYYFKDVAHYLIASPNEILGYGLPYRSAIISLLNNSYKGVCDDLYNRYENEEGSLSVTDLTKVEQMASFFKSIRSKYAPVSKETAKTIQTMDGYTPVVYYDLGDYAEKYITDENDLKKFKQLLDELVVYKRNTDYLYTDLPLRGRLIKMHTFSGLTISEPTSNEPVINEFKNCQWYIDTTFPIN